MSTKCLLFCLYFSIKERVVYECNLLSSFNNSSAAFLSPFVYRLVGANHRLARANHRLVGANHRLVGANYSESELKGLQMNISNRLMTLCFAERNR